MSAFGAADFPPLLLLFFFSLMPLKKNNFQAGKMRRRDAGRRCVSEDKIREEKEGESGWLLVCPSPCQPQHDCTPSHILLAVSSDHPSEQVPKSLITISKVAETLGTIITPVFLTVLKKSLERGRGNSPSTLPLLLVQEQKPNRDRQSVHNCIVHALWLVRRRSFT